MSNIRVHLELSPDLPATAADPHQLQQVFLNLVNNAVDAILENSVDGDLWVRTEAKEGRLFVEFTDSGPGVKDASRVFDPFYTTKPVGKGTGLGLSICYGIITEHGGTIRVRNVQPRGASFTIDLPYQSVSAAKGPNQEGDIATSRGTRLLLIDRDESVLEAVEAILQGRNHIVKTAATLAAAQSLLQQQEFDVVVADLDMPVVAGQETLEGWLTANKPPLAQRLIWMRASTGSDTKDVAAQNGSQVLQKPFNSADLLAAVESVLGHVQVAPIPG
jgi:two-component system NtrC family sensor kinase